jgi:ATP-dependent DNA helicase RecG
VAKLKYYFSMNVESNFIEYKSIKKVQTGDAGFKDLAVTCVCLANAQGGTLMIGVEDKTKEPPIGQTISQELSNEVVSRLRMLTYSVGIDNKGIKTHENEGQYIELNILPSLKTVATTTDGKIYIRIADQCQAVRSEDITRLAAEKDAFQWELQPKNISLSELNPIEIQKFVEAIRKSVKVKLAVKNKSDEELLEHYNLIADQKATNLGVLWLGKASQRARLSYPIGVQYIVYDEQRNKLRKETWQDNSLNPMDLLLEIERSAVELSYFHELPDGLFRKQVRHYSLEVLRELLVNAFVHKSYTISSDIFIEVFPDHLSITNPGGLPLGITSNNILHQRHRRNPFVINIMHDLGLMEGEGSGYDLIYEKLAQDAKAFPIIDSDFNTIKVTVSSKILDEEVIHLLDYIQQYYQISSREITCFGIIARHKQIFAPQLSKELQLQDEDRIRNWLGNLIELGVVEQRGVKKATSYLINPKIYEGAKLNLKPSLKTIETHTLKALIIEDLKTYPNSSINDIFERLRKEVPKDVIQRSIYTMVKEGGITPVGGKTYRKYILP